MTQFSVPWQQRRAYSHGIVARAVIMLARAVYALFAPFVSRFPGPIFISAVVAACLGVWAFAVLYGFVDRLMVDSANLAGAQSETFQYFSASTWGLTPSTLGMLLESRDGLIASMSGSLRYLLWPVQFGIVRDLISLGALFGLFNLIPVYVIWWERKVAGRIQSRVGPMRVGGWHGWAQSFADGIKLVLKEDLVPEGADAALFRVAPYFAIIPSALAFVALPFGMSYVFRDLDVSLVFILGVLGVEVLSTILAGWSSNNKWSVYGAMREACQVISYEIPMGMALLVPVLCVGSLSLRDIGAYQSGGWFSWIAFSNPFAFVAFISYFIASLASVKRAPFDLPEAESELVAGFLTEYSGFRWSLFFFAEYAAMFVIAALAAILFLGAWNSPLPLSWGENLGVGIVADGLRGLLYSGPIWLMLKAVFFIYVQLWIRWTLPRIRIDQVLYTCVQVLLPLTMVLVFGTALWVWAAEGTSYTWILFDALVTVVLGLFGLMFFLGFLVIAAYGFSRRRQLVGNLAVDLLPGS